MYAPLGVAHSLRAGAWIMVEGSVLTVIARYRQKHATTPESGGILTGLRRGDHLHITDLTCPGPDDRCERLAFHRSQRFHQQSAQQRWQRSQGVVDYMGEWHTHPQHKPVPSSTDQREWRALLRHYEQPLAFLIAGIGSLVWVGAGIRGQVIGQTAPTNMAEDSHG